MHRQRAPPLVDEGRDGQDRAPEGPADEGGNAGTVGGVEGGADRAFLRVAHAERTQQRHLPGRLVEDDPVIDQICEEAVVAAVGDRPGRGRTLGEADDARGPAAVGDLGGAVEVA